MPLRKHGSAREHRGQRRERQVHADGERQRRHVRHLDHHRVDADVHLFTGPKTMGEITRKNWIWFLLHDQIHHRGQLSIYLRIADGKVPAIYRAERG